MENHIRIIVWLKAVVLIISILLCAYAFVKSKIMGMQIKVRGISYMMAGSKAMYEIMRRALLFFWLLVDIIVLSWQVNRAMSGYPKYMNAYAEWSSIVMVSALFFSSVLYAIFYTPAIQDYLESKLYKNKNQ
jgi:hypothetical protein